ncbi:MAG: hypothetical protein K2P92_04925 [Bdellovibrionaceae bacterium]|nr:hypothetical protein [Pseudobdellovibrionaceae bacterium]
MKNKIIASVCLLLVLSCQKSNSSPAEGTPKPPVTAPSESPVKAEWQKKLEACPLQLTNEMSLEQVAETSSQMRKQCGFTESEWAQVVQQL